MRRKFETRLRKQWPPWGDGHPVARSMASGSSWFDAWVGQAATTWPLIERKTGITAARMFELHRGAEPSSDELTKLAGLWGCPVDDLITSRQGV